MKIAIRYYTKTGNTKRLAEAIGKAVGAEAQPISVPITEAVDILFLGNSYYAFTIDPEVRSFVLSLDKGKVGKIVNFGSAAMMNSTWKKVKAVADKVGIPMDEREFHCKGEFKGVHKGKPDETDIGYCIGQKFRGKGYAAELVKAMTGFAASRFGIRVIYGRVVHGNDASAKVLEKNGYQFANKEFNAEDDPYGNGMLIYRKAF